MIGAYIEELYRRRHKALHGWSNGSVSVGTWCSAIVVLQHRWMRGGSRWMKEMMREESRSGRCRVDGSGGKCWG